MPSLQKDRLMVAYIRGGGANNLKIRDLELFEDDLGRRNYRLKIKGKTGERNVILRASAARALS